KQNRLWASVSSITQRRINDKMIAKVTLLFLVAVAVSAKVEMEYHPQAVLHYLELKDQHLARKVRGMLKLDADFPRPSPSLPPGISKGLVKHCVAEAIKCHIAADEDACGHLKCIKSTACCLYVAGLRIKHLPEPVKKCLPIIPCCLEGSDSCEEKLGCFVKFGNCAKVLGDEKYRK
ncbi:unnamed protein product, partial [Porites evermanni]